MGQWGRIWKKTLNQFKENGILFKMTPQLLLLMAALIWNPRNAGKALLWEIYIEMRSNIIWLYSADNMDRKSKKWLNQSKDTYFMFKIRHKPPSNSMSSARYPRNAG